MSVPALRAAPRLVLSGVGPRRGTQLVVLAIVLSGASVMIGLDVRAPDLAAQSARALAAGQGAGLWWNGWFGGLATATYSVISGPLMSLVGVSTLAIASAVVIGACSAHLLRESLRPRLAALLAAGSATADLLSGRVTFALGAAFALLTLIAMARRYRLVTAVLAVMTALASPLAALGLATAALSAGATTRGRRMVSVLAMAGSAVPVLATALLFPGPSRMPFGEAELTPALAVCAVLVLACRQPAVRWFAALTALTAVAAFIVASPVGSNAARWPLLVGPPLIAAYARLDRRPVAALLALACGWTVVGLTGDLASARDPSGRPAYYTPLLTELGGLAVTGRIEVVDPVTHGADVYVSDRYALARGWERQVDYALNPLFYAPALSDAGYRAWLLANAVQYVALSNDTPDYGSQTEAALVRAGTPYLRLAWSGGPWRLYRVVGATPLVTGAATAVRAGSDGVTLRSTAGGAALAEVRYTPLLRLTNLATGASTPALSDEGDARASRLLVPAAGDYLLHG